MAFLCFQLVNSTDIIIKDIKTQCRAPTEDDIVAVRRNNDTPKYRVASLERAKADLVTAFSLLDEIGQTIPDKLQAVADAYFQLWCVRAKAEASRTRKAVALINQSVFAQTDNPMNHKKRRLTYRSTSAIAKTSQYVKDRTIYKPAPVDINNPAPPLKRRSRLVQPVNPAQPVPLNQPVGPVQPVNPAQPS